MKKLYIHIGTHKTGSTSLQNFMLQNSLLLNSKGIMYPETGQCQSAHHQLAWATGFGSYDKDNNFVSKFIAELVRQAEISGCDSILISSEELERVSDFSVLKGISEHFDVKIVVYLRKQDHYLESEYNEHVKSYNLRFSGSIYQFALKYNFFNIFNYKQLIQKWAKHFGDENIVVRPYQTKLVADDVCQDILSVMGYDSHELLSDKPHQEVRSNLSISKSALPYFSRINKLPLTKTQHQEAVNILRASFEKMSGGKLLSFSEANDFYAKFNSTNKFVFKKYLGTDEDPFVELMKPEVEYKYINHDNIDTELLLSLSSAILLSA